jgi:hypothetical protein
MRSNRSLWGLTMELHPHKLITAMEHANGSKIFFKNLSIFLKLIPLTISRHYLSMAVHMIFLSAISDSSPIAGLEPFE